MLATVIFGLTMSYHGKTAISPTVEHFMHEFWEMLGEWLYSGQRLNAKVPEVQSTSVQLSELYD